MVTLVVVVLAQAAEPATLDFRGLSAERAMVTLSSALGDLEACLVAPPRGNPGKPVVRSKPRTAPGSNRSVPSGC
jgi:hypothetical protein